MMSSVGLLNLSRQPWEAITSDECALLGVMCATALEMDAFQPVTLTLATGRTYSCTLGVEASISVMTLNGTQYTERFWRWMSSSVATRTRSRCLGPPKTIETVGANCTLPQGCGCGQDNRCSSWYQQHTADVSPSLAKFEVYVASSGSLATSISYSLFNTNTTPQTQMAVTSNYLEFDVVDEYLFSLLTENSTTTLVVLLNDTNLSAVGNTGVKCAANETAPGDPSIPTWSGMRSCGAGLRNVTWWLFYNRASVQSSATLNFSGVVWDIFPTNVDALSCFLIISSPLSAINAAVDASNARANVQLTTVRTEQQSRVAASGNATKQYISKLGAENTLASQAMEISFHAEMQAMDNTSMAALSASQERSTTLVQQLMDNQTTQIESLTSSNLDALAVTTGWTVAVVFAILFAVLLCSAWGTVHVTRDLTDIIGLMEDVAEMRVENLTIPQESQVTEVARIETAFEVLVRRLAEYKSYIPAGVFEKRVSDVNIQNGGGDDSDCDPLHCSESESQFTGDKSKHHQRSAQPDTPTVTFVQGSASSEARSVPSSLGPNTSMKNRAAVLSFYAFGFTDSLLQMTPALAKNLLSQCIAHVHEAASQSRGNIEFIAGDQIFVTFNTHVSCAEPAGAAMNAAMEMRRLLWPVARDRLKFQMGISFGPVLAGSVGYSKFRSMATLGRPMKVASMVSQMSDFESGTVLVDVYVEEKMKYAFDLRPVELVYFPQLAAPTWEGAPVSQPPSQPKHPSSTIRSERVFMVQSKREVDEDADEWLYQVDKMAPPTDWQWAFGQVAAAASMEEAYSHLDRFLEGHPHDAVALRLKGRLAMWTPGVGLPLWERAEHDRRSLEK
eukprot:GGOE01025137.1.p1 GENE.GGOE01025137.1~~GGOE01025137.1.p1  ORF type:complete len:844 (+),score=179.49 GGOE01025137.1:512-3043(+)